MTRSVTIVNTSSWDGEDYVIRTRIKGVMEGAKWDARQLKPGESFAAYPDHFDIQFEAVDSKTPEPFHLNDKQVFPRVISWVGRKESTT